MKNVSCVVKYFPCVWHTRPNTQVNQTIRILSVTLDVETAILLGSLKKDQGHRAQQVLPVVDSDSTRHVGNLLRDVLTFLSTSFLMYPTIGPPVTMPAVLLGVKTMTYPGVSRLLPLPGAGVYDPRMTQCLVSVSQFLVTGYHELLTFITVVLVLSLIRTLRQTRTIL